MRAFIGIGLPAAVREVLGALCVELRRHIHGVRWVAPEAMHVTLKFLGTITDEQRLAVEALIRRLVSREPTFQLRLGPVGGFPSLRSPRVVWVGFAEGEQAVVRLAEALEQGARELGFKAEERPFSAHVTLGRAQEGRADQRMSQRLSDLGWSPPAPCQATSVTLYQSHLSPTGAWYEVLADVPLGIGAAS